MVAARSQFCDQPQNLLEHLPWDSDLGHLEDDVTAVAHDLRADLDQLLLQARQVGINRFQCSLARAGRGSGYCRCDSFSVSEF